MYKNYNFNKFGDFMNKVIGIGTLNDNTKQLYHDILYSILGDKYNIISFNFNKIDRNLIDLDILLISTPLMINIVKKYIKPSTKVIIIRRTFTKKSYDILCSIKNNEKIYLVNNGIDVTFETISLIYSLGFDFELYPFYPGVEPIDEIKVAITTNEIHLIPDSVETIFNISHMVYDVETILDVLNELNLDECEKENILSKYQSGIITVEKGVNSLINSNFFIQQEINTIINLINEGVIETDNNGNIILANKISEKILGQNLLIYKNIKNVISELQEYIKYENYISDELINYRNEQLIVSIKPIYVFSEKVGNMIIFRNVTEIKRLEDKLRKSISVSGHIAKYHINDIVGNSNSFLDTKKLAQKMALANSTILITGESGTGKELFAQSIHNVSCRSKFPFLAINCATLPENLIESELFGYESGAFTGAKKEGKLGLFEQAHLGTLFLDEIAELNMNMQSRLLRVLQEAEIIRIGGTTIRSVDVRIIAATNKNLYNLAKEGRFRWDLFYRLNIFPLNIPPLRKRKEDIRLLFNYFINELNCTKNVDEELLLLFEKYDWPGNIRELKNIIEYLVFMSDSRITINNLPHTFNKYDNTNECKENLSSAQLSLLNILYNKFKNKEKVGRIKLIDLLQAKGYYMTEREVRRNLEYLQDKNLVIIGTGRQGTKITDSGINYCVINMATIEKVPPAMH